MIRNATKADAEEIVNIYNYYIEQTIITFDEEPLSVKQMEDKISDIQSKDYPFIIYESDNTVVAYAYLNTWRNRSAFDISLETSIYVNTQYQQKGIGKLLYRELILVAKQMKLHSLIAAISLPNESSITLHHKLEFELVGTFKEAGIKFEKLIDVEFWQLFI